MPSPRTALRTASVQLSGWSRRSAGSPMTSWACEVWRLPSRARSPAGNAGAGAKPGIAPLPVPNAAAASSTASAWPMSPATATTVLAGRYVVAQKSRIVVVRQRPDAGLVAADLAAERPVAEHRRLEQDLAYSAGSSWYERISSMITVRSPSISVASRTGRTMSSPRTSIARAASRRGTRTQ